MSAIQPSPHDNANIISPERISNVPAYAKDIDRPYVGEPWTRQNGETARAWEAFCHYRDSDPETRVIANTSRWYKDKYQLSTKDPDNHAQCYQWSSKNRWVERVESFDNFNDAKLIAKNRRRLLRASEQHAQQEADILGLLMRPVEEYRKRLTESGVDVVSLMSDEEVMKLAVAFSRDVPTHQKSQREALASTSQTVVSPVAVRAKGILVRRMLENKTLGSLMEAVSFETELIENSDEET